MSVQRSEKATYKKSLTQRHLIFLALGCAIGTGLFMGSGEAIKLTGPSVLLAYLIAGFMIFLVMRSLGEMVVKHPRSGAFGAYAARYISPLAGFLTGWTYILAVSMVAIADITAFSSYMSFWYPNTSPWIWSLAISLILTGCNLITVKMYGELEFILSGLKILAIIGIIIGGICLIVFGMDLNDKTDPNMAMHSIGIHNLWSHGGWFPNGIEGFIACFAIVVFAFGGIELVAIAASETKNVEREVPRSINSLPIRIILFYCLSLGILMCIYPWNQIPANTSPFVSIFENIGLSSAANILNIIVIIASVSAVNGAIYSASRILHGLSEQKTAPKSLLFIAKNGVPMFSVLLMFVVLVGGVVLNYLFHEGLFFLVAAMVTFATVFVWLMIVLSQIMMRLKLAENEKNTLRFPVPFWPVGPIIALLFMIFIIILLGVMPNSRPALICGTIWMAWLITCFYSIKFFTRKSKALS